MALGPQPLLTAVTFDSLAAIFEVGGVPYSLLEPVLERCTPDQLYRIEEYNHVSVLFGWEDGSFLACVSRNGFVSVKLLQLQGRPAVGPLFWACLVCQWAFKQASFQHLLLAS